MKQNEEWKEKQRRKRGKARRRGSDERQRHMLKCCEDCVQHAERREPWQGSLDSLGIPMTWLLGVWRQKSHGSEDQLFFELHRDTKRRRESVCVNLNMMETNCKRWQFPRWRGCHCYVVSHTVFLKIFYCQKGLIFSGLQCFFSTCCQHLFITVCNSQQHT